MKTTIKYIGDSERYSELDVTGNQSVWLKGQQEDRSGSEAAALLETGLFSATSVSVTANVDPVTGFVTGLSADDRDVIDDLSIETV